MQSEWPNKQKEWKMFKKKKKTCHNCTNSPDLCCSRTKLKRSLWARPWVLLCSLENIHNIEFTIEQNVSQNLSNSAKNLKDNQITNLAAYTTLGDLFFLVIWIIPALFSSPLPRVSLSVVQTKRDNARVRFRERKVPQVQDRSLQNVSLTSCRLF